jgi:hypothetical protein
MKRNWDDCDFACFERTVESLGDDRASELVASPTADCLAEWLADQLDVLERQFKHFETQASRRRAVHNLRESRD